MTLKSRLLFLSLIGCALMISLRSNAQDAALSTRIHNFYQTNRALGMGNAFSAAADDYASLFYNPANLSFRKSGEVQFNLISAGYTTQAPTMFQDITDASNTLGSDNDKATAVSNVLEKYYGKPVTARLNPLEYVWIRPHWGIALVVADVSVNSMIQRQVGPTLDLDIIKDTSFSYGQSWLFNSEMSIGALAKFSHRSQFTGSYSSLDLAMDSNVIDFKKSNEGLGLDFDIGFTWKPDYKVVRTMAQAEVVPTPTAVSAPVPAPVPAAPVSTELPHPIDQIDTKTDGIQIRTRKTVEINESVKPPPLTLSAVLRNILSLKYSKSTLINKDATEAPRAADRVLDLGVAYDLYQGDLTNLKVVGEAKNLMHTQAALNKSTHFGLEYSVIPRDWFSLQIRAGMNQLYYTAGLGFVFGPLNIEAVTYGEEFGTADVKIENRVNAVTLGFKF